MRAAPPLVGLFLMRHVLWLALGHQVVGDSADANALLDTLFINDGEADVGEETSMADDLVDQTARMFHNPVREANVGVIVKILTAMQRSPNTIAKILNWQDSVGATALHWCAFHGSETHAALVETFLRIPGTDANILDNHANTACHTACMKGHVSVLAHLVHENRSNSCDPFALNAGGMSCLHYAAKRGDAQTLRILGLDRMGTDVDIYSAGVQASTPLYLAVEAGSVESVRILMEAGASGSRGRRSSSEYSDEASFELAKREFGRYQSILELIGDIPSDHPKASRDERHAKLVTRLAAKASRGDRINLEL